MMMYMTFAVLFIAPAHGIQIPLPDRIMPGAAVRQRGISGVPRASLIVISAILAMFHIPEAGMLLLLGVDQVLDMGRSATNMLGNSPVTAVVSRWEQALMHWFSSLREPRLPGRHPVRGRPKQRFVHERDSL